jgi:hypothetical protein
MYPFECSKCRKRVHAQSASKAVCCENANFQPLVNICLLVVEKELDKQPIVHVSGPSPLPSPIGARWGVACGAKKLPAVTTRLVEATTCKRCLDWYEKKVKELTEKAYQESIEYEEV